MNAMFPAPQPSQEEAERRWVPVVVGAGIVILVVALFVIFGRNPQPPDAEPPQPEYASNLQITDLKLSAAENFVGATVSYLDGKITNVGDKTVSGCRVQVVFRNSMGQIVDKQSQPLMVLQTRPGFGYEDLESLSKYSLTPNQTRQFRLTFEHISSDWDRGYPELRVLSLDLK